MVEGHVSLGRVSSSLIPGTAKTRSTLDSWLRFIWLIIGLLGYSVVGFLGYWGSRTIVVHLLRKNNHPVRRNGHPYFKRKGAGRAVSSFKKRSFFKKLLPFGR